MVGKPKSCTACRQAKTSCDARRKAPGICSRCSERKLACRFDNSFRRIATRQLAQDIVNDIHNLQASQTVLEIATPESHGMSQEWPGDVESTFLPHGDVTPEDFCLGSLSISSDAANDLLEYFGRHYWTHAPFLEPIASPSRIATSSPLLFWSLILVASRKHSKYGYLYSRDIFPLRELLAPITTKAIRSIEDIQALLCLCLWPIPQRRELDDPSWDYVGLAVNACISLRLHKSNSQLQPSVRPADHQSTSFGSHARIRSMTWLACFCMSTQLATFHGFMPPLSSPYYLKSVRRAIDSLSFQVTPDYSAKIAVYEAICNYTTSLDEVEEPAAKLSLCQNFDRALTSIEQTYSANWTTELDVKYQFARLNLYASVLVAQQPVSSPQTLGIQHETMIYKGLAAASSLIQSMRHIRAGPLQDPKHYFANLFIAAMFLFRTIIDNPVMDQEHKLRAMQLINDVQNIYSLLVEYPEALRAARLLNRVMASAYTRPDGRAIPGYIIDDRFGASMLWDTLSRVAPTSEVILQDVGDIMAGQSNRSQCSMPALPDAPLADLSSLDSLFPMQTSFLASDKMLEPDSRRLFESSFSTNVRDSGLDISLHELEC